MPDKIIFDMEWNQPLPWKQYPKVSKALLMGEIIQIGAIKLNGEGKRIGEFRCSVRPRYFKQVHWKVKKLTHISEDEMLNGIEFPEAMRRFGSWCTADGTGTEFWMFAWGGEDERVLCANLEAWGLNLDWVPEQIYDLRLIYDGLNGKIESSTALTDAAEAVGFAPELEQHDSLNDACYAAAVCAATDVEAGIAAYEELGTRPELPHGGQRRMVGGLREQTDAFTDQALCGFQCPVCGEALQCRDWVPQNKDRQIGLVSCSRRHKSFLRIRFNRRPDGSLNALRLVYPASAEAADFYRKKYNKQQEAIKRAKKQQNGAQTAPQSEGGK